MVEGIVLAREPGWAALAAILGRGGPLCVGDGGCGVCVRGDQWVEGRNRESALLRVGNPECCREHLA